MHLNASCIELICHHSDEIVDNDFWVVYNKNVFQPCIKWQSLNLIRIAPYGSKKQHNKKW